MRLSVQKQQERGQAFARVRTHVQRLWVRCSMMSLVYTRSRSWKPHWHRAPVRLSSRAYGGLLLWPPSIPNSLCRCAFSSPFPSMLLIVEVPLFGRLLGDTPSSAHRPGAQVQGLRRPGAQVQCQLRAPSRTLSSKQRGPRVGPCADSCCRYAVATAASNAITKLRRARERE